MDRVQAFDGFQFDDDRVVDDEIEFETTFDSLPLVVERNSLLTRNAKILALQLEEHAFLVDGLQQSRPERPMHLDGAADYFLGQFVDG